MRTLQYYQDEIQKIDDLREKLGESITMKQSRELARKRANMYKNVWRFNNRNNKVK